MQSVSTVETADRYSRKRAIIVAAAAIVFLGVQFLAPAFFGGGPEATHRVQRYMWFVNAAVLLLALVTGGGLMNSRPIRALVNDDVSRGNYRTSVVAGYWVAMIVAMALYALPGFAAFSAREAVYAIVTSSIGVALLAFAWLEYRAHRDA
jgi:hypothetical protein